MLKCGFGATLMSICHKAAVDVDHLTGVRLYTTLDGIPMAAMLSMHFTCGNFFSFFVFVFI